MLLRIFSLAAVGNKDGELDREKDWGQTDQLDGGGGGDGEK